MRQREIDKENEQWKAEYKDKQEKQKQDNQTRSYDNADRKNRAK